MGEISSWPDMAILIVTYDRPAEIRRTIEGLRAFLHYEGKLMWFACDDGSPTGYIEALQQDFPELAITVSVTQRKGWGTNVNTGLRMCSSYEYVFLVEDDYVALQDINLTAGVALLEARSDIGLVRYDGIAGHDLNLQLREADTRLGRLQCMILDRKSPCLNVYSNRPHLRSRRFVESYGWYPEGKTLGQTEEGYAHHVKDIDGVALVCLETGIPSAFLHIGQSRQGTKEDVNGRIRG